MGLEVVLAERDFEVALAELEARLTEREGFYRGTAATAAFGSTVPTLEQIDALRAVLAKGGVELSALGGSAAIELVAKEASLGYIPQTTGDEISRRRALRPKGEIKLSESAKSLVADFAGARADIADRRKRGEASVRRPVLPPKAAAAPPAVGPLHVVAAQPGTLFHVGTLRGGQALHHLGNIVVVGDVNPGTELVATGDIVVFGRLRGVAHAGAQGDANARVYALHLDATQLRIATCIAAEDGTRKGPVAPEVALVRDGRIAIVSFDSIDQLPGG